MAILISKADSILEVGGVFQGTTQGPVYAMFLLGMLTTRTNEKVYYTYNNTPFKKKIVNRNKNLFAIVKENKKKCIKYILVGEKFRIRKITNRKALQTILNLRFRILNIN